jgi:hypothetical protein
MVGIAAFGGLGGGNSTASIAEIPSECIEFEDLVRRCYGKTASGAPWHATKGRDVHASAMRCAEERDRLRRVCHL